MSRKLEIREFGNQAHFMLRGANDVPRAGLVLGRMGTFAAVIAIRVERSLQRKGIGTRLYLNAAKFACKQWGVPLASDTARTAESESFWQKQVRKGRAKCIDSRQPGQRIVYNDLEAQGDWPCARFALSCPAPRSLRGAKRR